LTLSVNKTIGAKIPIIINIVEIERHSYHAPYK
jgi:hypothetical protein